MSWLLFHSSYDAFGGRYYVVSKSELVGPRWPVIFTAVVVRTFLYFDFGRTRTAGFGDFLHTIMDFCVPENVKWLEIVPVNDYICIYT